MQLDAETSGEFGNEWEPVVETNDSAAYELPHDPEDGSEDEVQRQLLTLKGGFPHEWESRGKGEGFTLAEADIRNNETGEAWEGFSAETIAQLKESTIVLLDDIVVDGEEIVTFLTRGPGNSIGYEMYATKVREQSEYEDALHDRYESIADDDTYFASDDDIQTPNILEEAYVAPPIIAAAGGEAELGERTDIEEVLPEIAAQEPASVVPAPFDREEMYRRAVEALQRRLPVYDFGERAYDNETVDTETPDYAAVARDNYPAADESAPVPLASPQEISLLIGAQQSTPEMSAPTAQIERMPVATEVVERSFAGEGIARAEPTTEHEEAGAVERPLEQSPTAPRETIAAQQAEAEEPAVQQIDRLPNLPTQLETLLEDEPLERFWMQPTRVSVVEVASKADTHATLAKEALAETPRTQPNTPAAKNIMPSPARIAAAPRAPRPKRLFFVRRETPQPHEQEVVDESDQERRVTPDDEPILARMIEQGTEERAELMQVGAEILPFRRSGSTSPIQESSDNEGTDGGRVRALNGIRLVRAESRVRKAA